MHFYLAQVSFVSLQVSQVINSSFGYSFQIQALRKNVFASLLMYTYNRLLLKRPKFQRIAYLIRMLRTLRLTKDLNRVLSFDLKFPMLSLQARQVNFHF